MKFPIFGGSCIKLVSSEQNFINWHICQSQTHLLLLKDKEKFLLKLLGKNWIVIKRLSSQLSGFLWNFAFLSQQNNIVFFILLVHYQRASMQLVSAFRHRRRRVCVDRAHFQNHPWARTLHSAELLFETARTMYHSALSLFYANLFGCSLHHLCWLHFHNSNRWRSTCLNWLFSKLPPVAEPRVQVRH